MEIILNNVSKVIRRNTVVDNVNLSLKSGFVYGLCGYNGCGKTMLMRLISGLIIPTSGEILIDGKKLGSQFDFPDSMGVMIENPAFLGSLSGFENLKLLSSIKNQISDSEISNAIKRVGLKSNDKKKYRKYSLGMKQRLGVAAAIMESPDLIILDEPTNALDADGVKIIQNIINEERNRGALQIITCHDKEILDAVCDMVFIIEHGKIISKNEV